MTPFVDKDFDICIIGSGVAGLTAAQHCAERGAEVVCIDCSGTSGGAIANIGKLDSYPSTTEISGAALAEQMAEACKSLGVRFETDTVLSIEKCSKGYLISTNTGKFSVYGLILASGSQLRQLEVPGEVELFGKGVSQCDWCDGGFFKNEPVVVIGGGDAAFQAALHLAATCKSVTLVMRGASIRARRAYVQAAGQNERIEFRWESIVERIIGSDRVEAVSLKNPNGEAFEILPTSGVFVFIGSNPNTKFLVGAINLDESGAVTTNASYLTNLAHVYAVGSVRSGNCGQLMSACGEGAAAASSLVDSLKREEKLY